MAAGDSGKGLYDHLYRRFFEQKNSHHGYDFQRAPGGSTLPATVTFRDRLKWWTWDRWRRRKQILAQRDRLQKDILDIKKLALLAILISGWLVGPQPVLAIQKESQAEKEANLKEQALGGLFNRWTFDQQKPDEAPAGFSALNQTGEGMSQWTIGTDDEAPSIPNVLRAMSTCQSATCSRLLVADKLQYEYPDISVRLRFPDEGGIGGLIIEFKDAANFYAVTVDLSKKLLQTIRVADGKETVLGQTTIMPKAVPWHSLRVQRDTIISKDVINAYFDGLLVLSVQDQTFSRGQVGLLAQGKSPLLFDSLHAVPLFTQRPFSDPAAY